MELLINLPLELMAWVIIKQMGLPEEDFPSSGPFFPDACPEPSPGLQFGNDPLDDVLKRTRARDMGEVEPVYP